MKKSYPVSKKARAIGGWRRHLRKEEKRRVNKSTRRENKKLIEYCAGCGKVWPCKSDCPTGTYTYV
jgi:hypothetical protein